MSFLNIKSLQYLNCGPIHAQLEACEVMGLYGASGSGKTRLLRALADMDEHQGDVLLHSVEQKTIQAHEWRSKIALLSAETYWWHDTVGEHFKKFPLEQATALGFANNVAGWQVSRLSSGEKQRLGLLRLLENQPEVLLLDEPTANLDPENVRLFESFVLDYLQSRPACAIWVSHDVEQLKRVSHRRYRIHDGLLVSESEDS